jgi:hypothetical protein
MLTIKRVFEILDEQENRLTKDVSLGKVDCDTWGRLKEASEIKHLLIKEIGEDAFYTLVHYGYFR